jgi:hypothetical protein
MITMVGITATVAMTMETAVTAVAETTLVEEMVTDNIIR